MNGIKGFLFKKISDAKETQNKSLFVGLLIVIVLSLLYLMSAKNISGMLWGDGYFHSLFAQNIFDTGEIQYEWPNRIFEGLKIDGELHNYPIQYTQFYHLGLAIFNNVLGLDVFSVGYTVLVNVLIVIFSYLCFREYKNLRVIIPVSVILLGALRFFHINFLEGYLLLTFLVFFYLVKKFTQFKEVHTTLLLIGVFFLGCMVNVKHLGVFGGVALFTVLTLYLLYKRRIKLLLYAVLVFIGVTLGPLYSQNEGVGTIGYGVGTVYLPESVPFSERITENFTSSDYQYKSDWVYRRLSYQNKSSSLENLNQVSNYFVNYGGEKSVINIFFLISVGIGLYHIFRRSVFQAVLIVVLLFIEFVIFDWIDPPLWQYNVLLVSVTNFLFWLGMEVTSRKGARKIYLLVIPLILVVSYFLMISTKIYNNVGRKRYDVEFLYSELGTYLEDNAKYDDALFLASDPQFGYWTGHDYVWYSDLFWEDWEDGVKMVTDYYGVDYIIVSSVNFESIGLNDEIPKSGYYVMKNDKRFHREERFEEGLDYIEIWKVSSQ